MEWSQARSGRATSMPHYACRSAGRGARIVRPDATVTVERWLPRFDVRERHAHIVPLPPEQALEVALAVPVAPDRLVRALFRLRGLSARDETIGSFSSRGGFVALERTPTTYVFGAAVRLRGEPRVAADADAWRRWRPPGVKVAADFRAEPAGAGATRLSTETRVLALDRRTRVVFRLYWLVVGPFSAVIRRRWLRAIAERAGQARLATERRETHEESS